MSSQVPIENCQNSMKVESDMLFEARTYSLAKSSAACSLEELLSTCPTLVSQNLQSCRMLRKLQKSCWSSGLPLLFAALCVNFLNHHCFSSWWILQNFYVYGSKPFTLITWSLPCQRICPTKVILHFCRTAWMLWMDASPICEAGISTQLQAAHIRSTCRLLCLLPKYIKALPSCTSLNVTGSGRLVFASLHA